MDDIRAARTEGSTVSGVNLPGLSPAWAWSPDYTHCILMSVSGQLTDLWRSGGGDNNCAKELLVVVICQSMRSMTMPECVNHHPRALETRRKWKASGWQGWLLHYGIPCPSGSLDSVYKNTRASLIKDRSISPSETLSVSTMEKKAGGF